MRIEFDPTELSSTQVAVLLNLLVSVFHVQIAIEGEKDDRDLSLSVTEAYLGGDGIILLNCGKEEE